MIYIETATFALSIIIVRQQLSIWLKEAWIPAFTPITTISFPIPFLFTTPYSFISGIQ